MTKQDEVRLDYLTRLDKLTAKQRKELNALYKIWDEYQAELDAIAWANSQKGLI